jgi:hypothetical protein
MNVFDGSDLPEDPRDDGFVDAHGPDGRIARVREVDEAFMLVDPDSGKRYEISSGGFLVWEDGTWRAIEREEFLDGAWDVNLGDSGVSAMEAIEDESDERPAPPGQQST